jgi:FkbM family methyltransferase
MRRVIIWAGDPPIEARVGSRALAMPASHDLPFYRAAHPEYSEAVGWIAGAMLERDPGLKVIDIGANVGDTVAIIRAYSRVPVLCVEGDDRFFRFLQSNADTLGEVSLAKAFLGERHATVVGRMAHRAGSARLQAGPKGRELQILTLPELLRDHPDFARARFVIIDTDGMDTAILVGAESFLREARPVVFFEYDPDLTAAAGDDARRGLEVLKRVGYGPLMAFENTGRYMWSSDLADADQMIDLHQLMSGHRGRRYVDVCAFPRAEMELWSHIRGLARLRPVAPIARG